MLASPVPQFPSGFGTSSLFDAPRDSGARRHGGLDINGRRSSQLVAPEAGHVERIYVSTQGGGGSIWLDHGRLVGYGDPSDAGAAGHVKTKHQHIALGSDGKPLFLVPEGGSVSRRQPFAMIGASGNATAVHDHYEVHVDGRRIDPRQVTVEAAVIIDDGRRYGFLRRYPAARSLLPGPYSRLAQMYLNWWGAHLDVDGIFGPLTGMAVRLLQRRFGLDDDEIVGVDTWTMLAPSIP